MPPPPATSTTRLVLLTVALAAVGGAMVAIWMFPEQSSAGATSLARTVSEATDGAAAPVLSRLGLGTEPVPGADPNATESTIRPRADVELPPRRRAAPLPPAQPRLDEPPQIAIVAETPELAALVEQPSTAPLFEEGIFSRADADVLPPQPLQATFPSSPPLGVNPDRLGIVEYVVDHAGNVERVILVRGPQDVLDTMLLPAVKAWRFTPAMRNGKPVRYRQRVLLTY